MNLTPINDLLKLAESLSVPIQVCEDTAILAQPVRVGHLVAPNSLAVNPMEGCDADAEGRPGKLTLRRYERFAAGGAGLLWLEATAVVPEGRANPRQLWLNEKSKDSFAAMVKRIRHRAAEEFGPEHRPIIVAQLTHSGRYSRPDGTPHPLIAQHDPYRDKAMKLPSDSPVLDDPYLDRLQDAYVEAARMAFETGFDAVDIKSCHGYLVNELLACRNRSGKYGGSFENRTRFLLDVVDRIHQELGEDRLVVARLGIYSAIPYPYGWGVDEDDHTRPDLTESKRLVAELVKRGVPMVNVTIGNPYYNPHYGRPYNKPTADGYESPEHPLVGVARIIGLAGEIQRAFPDVAIVGSGYSWLGAAMPFVAAASKRNGLAAFTGLGRMAFAYPDFARDILTHGRLNRSKVCLACSACTQLMYDGRPTGCVVRDSRVYGPIHRRSRAENREQPTAPGRCECRHPQRERGGHVQ